VVGNPDGKRPQGRPFCRYEITIQSYLKRKGLESADCNNLTQNRENWQAGVNAVMDIQVMENARNLLTSCDTIRFSMSILIDLVSYR
jgi:hypothetical protein